MRIKPNQQNLEKNYLLSSIARLGIQHAMNGLSEMVGEKITNSEPQLFSVPILKIPDFLGGAENEAVGIYLRSCGEASGQFIMILPIARAFEFIDLLMEEPYGSTQTLDDMGRSALAEMGNLAGTFFLNAMAELTGLETRPSEPVVMFDMVGAILGVIVATSAEHMDEVIVIETTITHAGHEVQASYWYIPDEKTMQRLIEMNNE